MKTVYFEKLPKCDFAPGCEGDAVYDAPTENGQWAHMCEHHYKMHAGSNAERLGCKLAQRDRVKAKGGEVKIGIEPGDEDLDYWEGVLYDSQREIECPECGCGRTVEPDATGIFTCEGCGQSVKCPSPIF